MYNGQFGPPDTIASGSLSANEEMNSGGNEEQKELNDKLGVKMSIREDKPPNTKRLTFSIIGHFDNYNPLFISMYEVIGENKKFIYQTKPTSKIIKDSGKENYHFSNISINTDVFENDILTTKKIEVRVTKIKKGKNNSKSYELLGKRRLKLKSILELREK